MRNFGIILLLITGSFVLSAQSTFNFPVDVVYHEPSETYYVSNWADGGGYILKVNALGEIEEPFITGLHYPGGLCLVGDILYFTDNLSIWDTLITPSYLRGINVNNNSMVLDFEISTTGTYLDLMDTDNNGNLFIGNSREGGANGIVHKFNIATHQLTDIATGITKPFGVCYDAMDDRVLFIHSSGTLSFVKSVSPEGGTVTNIFYINGYLEGIDMHPNGDFYLSSWGTFDGEWGNEPVYKANHAMDWSTILESDHNRPFGMCIGKDNHLVICNWGENSLSFVDLDEFGVDEFSGSIPDVVVYPNPSDGLVTLKMNTQVLGSMEIIVQDLTGRIVMQDVVNFFSSNPSMELDLRTLSPGTYVIHVTGKQASFHKKVIIY